MDDATAAIAFGLQVKRFRRAAGLSQEALAVLASMNKETVMRIERGYDAHVTTIGKLRKVLPDIPGAARNEDTLTMTGTTLGDMAARIGHLVQGFTSQDRLHKVRAYVLAQLQAEHDDVISPDVQRALDGKQVQAEQRLVIAAQKQKRGGRRAADPGQH